jgi:multidrug efflux pump subunit AcrB
MLNLFSTGYRRRHRCYDHFQPRDGKSAASAARNITPGGAKIHASSLVVCLITLKGERLNETQLRDLGPFTVRNQVANVPGASVPVPFGGKYRQIMVYVARVKLEAHQLSVMDVVRSVNDSNLILPAGDVTIGPFDYNLYTNSQLHYANCTTLNVMSLMVVGMIVGIVASNSILIVEFAHRLIDDDAPRGGTICCPWTK